MPALVSEKQVVDLETGEVIEATREIHQVQKRDSRPWVKLYLDAWTKLKNIRGFSDSTCDVLYQLLCLYPTAYADAKRLETYTGERQLPLISPSPVQKKQWSVMLNTSVSVINNNISKLAKMGILTRVGRGAYLISPELIGYGTETEIESLRSISGKFVITPDGAKIEPNFD